MTRHAHIKQCECEDDAFAEFESDEKRCERDDTIIDKDQCHKEAEMKLEKALSECEPKPPSCEDLAIERYMEGK
jgi:hypothetical protein